MCCVCSHAKVCPHVLTGYQLEGNKYTRYHRQGFEIPNNLPELEKYIRYTKYLSDGADTGIWREYISNPFVKKSNDVCRVQYYTVQYPSSSTEIPTGRK